MSNLTENQLLMIANRLFKVWWLRIPISAAIGGWLGLKIAIDTVSKESYVSYVIGGIVFGTIVASVLYIRRRIKSHSPELAILFILISLILIAFLVSFMIASTL